METIEKNKGHETIGEMVARDYRKAEVFKKYGIDFCCGGKKTVESACLEKGIDPNEVNNALHKLDNAKVDTILHFSLLEPDDLIYHIINVHHKYVAEAIPLLIGFSDKVAGVHGTANPEVIEINRLFRILADELTSHMQKEERILFPYIERLLESKQSNVQFMPPPFGTIVNPINLMEAEHSSAGDVMDSIRELSNDYNPPDHACNTFRVLYAKLEEFENDLHQHVHLENNILFPKAIELEKEILN